MAWTDTKVGSAHRDVIVRDTMAVTAAAPRFLTLGDKARLELALHNVEGGAGTYTITGTYMITGAGLGDASGTSAGISKPAFERQVQIGQGDRKREAFELAPTDVGLMQIAVRVSGPGVEINRKLTFDVKVPAGDIKRLSVSSLAKNGGPSRGLERPLPGPDPAEVAGDGDGGSVRWLRRAGPARLARPLSLWLRRADHQPGPAAALRQRRRASRRPRQRCQHQRAYRKGDRPRARHAGQLWCLRHLGPIRRRHVAHELRDRLPDARQGEGHKVPDLAFKQALDRLQNFIGYAKDFESGGEGRAYALYVLARNGRAPIGELRYYADTKLENFSTPLALAQLGAALSMMGDKPRAEKALSAALKSVTTPGDAVSRRDYGSQVRDGAALITLASEAGLAKTEMPRLVDVVAQGYRARSYTSTQEQAWMLLAARALGEEAASMRLSLNGEEHTGQFMRALKPEDLKTGALTIVNRSDAPVEAVVSTVGAALTPEPAAAKGFTIERTYYTLDGKEVDLKSAKGGTSTLAQTDRSWWC